MNVKYDFHIHTALSPCALEEMSPNNIVNMAIISGLDAIAVTDHNSGRNVEAVLNVSEETDLIVLPGMEVESKEEIHVVCLFSDLDCVYNMQTFVYSNLPKMKNRSKVLGKQLLFNEEDEVIGEEEQLLSFATSIPFDVLIQKTWELGGIAIPAHIDRPSYSVISNLGILPSNLDLSCLEISQYADYAKYRTKYYQYLLLQSSDAHELGHIGICQREFMLNNLDCELLDNVEKKDYHILLRKKIIQFLRNAPNC
ncbi:MAG: PHP domain-containing protein [Vallitaleaceae bacterium]|nr:PHP domain-containing protein [Vallitaleaceae bacterium]